MADRVVTNLVAVNTIADKTLQITLKRPNTFDFQAGQNVTMKLDALTYEDKRGPQRTFTIASAPHEENLTFTTRKTGSGFKRTLEEGTLERIELFGPRGEMVRNPDKTAVMIAGGIGITPFRSMILDAVHKKNETPVLLIYANPTLERCVYHDLFTGLDQDDSIHFNYVPTLTNLERIPADWNGEQGRVDSDFIKHHVPEYNETIFYLCGPPQMVNDLESELKKHSVDSEQIRSESFWGY